LFWGQFCKSWPTAALKFWGQFSKSYLTAEIPGTVLRKLTTAEISGTVLQKLTTAEISGTVLQKLSNSWNTGDSSPEPGRDFPCCQPHTSISDTVLDFGNNPCCHK